MNWHEYVRARLTEITGDAARDEEIVEELALHLAQRFEEVRASCATDEAAFDQVTRELADSPTLARALREASRRRRVALAPPPAGGHVMSDLWQDCRYAVRLLRRTPAFTVTAMLTLALGIGMTTAIFSVVQAVLLRPVPMPEPDRLLMVWETDRDTGTTREPASIPDLVDFRTRTRALDRLSAFTSFEMDMTPDHGDSVRVSALAVTADFMALVGVRPIAGRLMTADEDVPRGPAVAVISDRLAEDLFVDAARAIGGSVRLNGRPRTIVGVVPSSADFGVLQILSAAAYARGFADRAPRSRVDVWVPLQADAGTAPRGNHGTLMVGRLGEGSSPDAAQDELSLIAADLEREYPNDNRARGIFVEPIRDVVFGRTETALLVLMAAVSLVLVISCVNVANLLLARATSRLREVAVRSALGAESHRLARQFVVENVVLTVLAAALGVLIAFGTLRALVIVAPANIPRLATVSLDMTVLLVALGASILIGIVLAVVPVAQARRADLQSVLRAEDSHSTPGVRESHFVRSWLVVAEVALAVILVTGAGLLIKSFWHIRQINPGFNVTGVVKAEFQLPPPRYPVVPGPRPSIPAKNRFMDALLERVEALPGVDAAALAAAHPLDAGFTTSFAVAGREAEAASWPEISLRAVTPGYFPALQVPLAGGRFLDASDSGASPLVVVVNQAVAERFFPGQDPVGRQLQFWGFPWTIVGVVGNERFQGVTQVSPIAAYTALAQVPLTAMALMVRTSGDTDAIAPSMRGAIREIDPELAVFGIEALEDTLSNSVGEQRFTMLLLAVFAGLALALAAIGIHGVLTYIVAQRTREIGIRMALGASASRVTRLVVAQGVRLTLLGLVCGFALALAFSQGLSGMLFGVTPTDVLTLSVVVVVLGIVACVSIWLPARRAVRVDPLIALRQE